MILMFIEKIMKMHNTLVSYGVIVVKGLCKVKYLRWGNETWKYLMHENNGGTEENFCKALIDTGVSSLIAFQ